jgi:hypothetical protein
MRSLRSYFSPLPYRPHAAALLAAALCCCAAAQFFPATRAQAAEAPDRRFHRAALVLQRLAPEQPWAAVAIPRGTERDDRASALLHHSDRLFVISSMALEMDGLSDEFSAAPHYAALAYRLAGRTRDAARCMARYREKAPFNAADALFVVRCLYESGEYTAMRTAAAAWQKEERGCNEERLAYIWGSWIAQGDYREARYAVNVSQCSGWYPDTLDARARYLAGEEPEAEAAIELLVRRYPDEAHRIRSLWTERAAHLRHP